ncbi:MAG: porin [Pseudomonadota bacterium]
MSIRPLLLGMAATLVSSGITDAADAVIVQPEPVDYVRVCDAYGAGFFFIPGTEICIRFSGYVRSAYEKLHIEVDNNSQLNGVLVNPGAIGVGALSGGEEANFTAWGNRARLNIDTRNETDYGTLRALYRLEGGQSNVDADIDMDTALISLAGFRAGFGSASYWSSNHDFGWVNAESVSSAAGGVGAEDGFYGFDDGTVFDYTWSDNGLAITVGAEDLRGSLGRDSFGNLTNSGSLVRDILGNVIGNVGDVTDGRVNFYAGVNYSAHWGAIAFTAAYDSIAPEITVVTPGVFGGSVVSDTGGWAYKVSANLNLSDYISGGSVWGMYMYDGDYNTDYVHANALLENPENAWGAAFQMNLTNEVEFWVNYWDVEGGTGHVFNTGGLPTVGNLIQGTNIEEGGVRQFGIGLNWYPTAAPGFHVKTSYFRGDVDNSGHVLVCTGFLAVGPQGCSFEYDGYVVSVRRDF